MHLLQPTTLTRPRHCQRRSGRTREVRCACASLVGSRRASVRAIAQDQSAAAGLDRSRHRRPCRQARRSTSAAAAASWPKRWLRRRARDRHRSRRKALGVAKAAQARIRASPSTIGWSRPKRSPRKHRGFDVVTCMELLEHVPDPASMVAACARLVRPGGIVVCSTINRNPKSYLFAVIGAEYVLQLLPKGTHDYAKFIQPAELAAFARRAGLAPTTMIGMTYNPLTKVYRLLPDTSVNYVMAFQAGMRMIDSAAAEATRGEPLANRGADVEPSALAVDAVLFDLDGTLADTAPDLIAALTEPRPHRPRSRSAADRGSSCVCIAWCARHARRGHGRQS